ncbi:MAG: biosynthetic-type acetolactate synthase large subunit [Caldicoprobacterales bacterium]|jgi:acetolactate synthase-1/2/3 large subunit|nr:biosynthetic-type acetolactate synthase large subunit [Clostridiales bacterium]
MKMTGAEAVVRALELEGADLIFGYPGGAVTHIYDALHRSDIHHVLVRNEQAAAHAANGYARVTGKVGVCIATSGPGATNMITGIATAYMDSIPMVAITGQVPLSMVGRDVFQEADITGATEPFTKYSYLVKDVNDIPRIFKEAFYLASTGRPGPVLIDIPKDISMATLDFKYPDQVKLRGYKPTYEGHPGQIKRMAKAILESSRPVICIGGGAISSNATPEIIELAETIKAPVASTLMGIGAFPGDHELSLGFLGQHGVYAANRAVSEADLLILLGARMGDRATGKTQEFAQRAKVIHMDIDPAEIGKNVEIDIPIVGDIKTTLKELLKKNISRQDWGWLSTVKKWKAKTEGVGHCTQGLNPMEIIKMLSDMVPEDTVLVTDVGQHQMWAARYYKTRKPRTFLTSGGLGTMGYGLPAALGAKLGCRDKEVILIVGDGGFQMSLGELATIVQERAEVKIMIFNNGYLGMVREIQQQLHEERYYQTAMQGNPDFVKLAHAYGIKSFRVEKEENILEGIRQLLEYKGPIIGEFVIDPTANVIPVSRRDNDETTRISSAG